MIPFWDYCKLARVRLLGVNVLDEFMRKHPPARSPVRAWIAEVREATWTEPSEVLQRYPRASIVNGHFLFRLGGNKYRLDTRIDFVTAIVLALRAGTHSQYDNWNFD